MTSTNLSHHELSIHEYCLLIYSNLDLISNDSFFSLYSMTVFLINWCRKSFAIAHEILVSSVLPLSPLVSLALVTDGGVKATSDENVPLNNFVYDVRDDEFCYFWPLFRVTCLRGLWFHHVNLELIITAQTLFNQEMFTFHKVRLHKETLKHRQLQTLRCWVAKAIFGRLINFELENYC